MLDSSLVKLFPRIEQQGLEYSGNNHYPSHLVLLALCQTNFLFLSGNLVEFELKWNIKVKWASFYSVHIFNKPKPAKKWKFEKSVQMEKLQLQKWAEWKVMGDVFKILWNELVLTSTPWQCDWNWITHRNQVFPACECSSHSVTVVTVVNALTHFLRFSWCHSFRASTSGTTFRRTGRFCTFVINHKFFGFFLFW